MAKTQAEWFSTLQSWVPSWFFQESGINQSVFQAMAKLLEASQLDVEDSKAQTMILQATAPYLDLHGSERGVVRLVGEFDGQYAVRVQLQSLVSQLSKPSLSALVNALLIRGVASIREDFEGSIFADRSEFVNRGAIIIEPIENTFTILVDKQLRGPHSFVGREYFADRSAFVGNSESSEYILELILKAVNDNKALGTFYRIIERLE